MTAVPGHEGSVGPFLGQYGQRHVYARDIHSGAGNCVCGRDVGHRLHTEAAPGVPVPPERRHSRGPGALTPTDSGPDTRLVARRE